MPPKQNKSYLKKQNLLSNGRGTRFIGGKKPKVDMWGNPLKPKPRGGGGSW